MARVVYAKDTCSTGLRDGVTVRLVRGDVWAADDLIVQERPDLFSDEPTAIRRTGPDPTPDTRVEQATRNPGQRRNR